MWCLGGDLTDVKRSVYLERTALKLKAMFLGNGHGFKKKGNYRYWLRSSSDILRMLYKHTYSKEFFMKDIND